MRPWDLGKVLEPVKYKSDHRDHRIHRKSMFLCMQLRAQDKIKMALMV